MRRSAWGLESNRNQLAELLLEWSSGTRGGSVGTSRFMLMYIEEKRSGKLGRGLVTVLVHTKMHTRPSPSAAEAREQQPLKASLAAAAGLRTPPACLCCIAAGMACQPRRMRRRCSGAGSRCGGTFHGRLVQCADHVLLLLERRFRHVTAQRAVGHALAVAARAEDACGAAGAEKGATAGSWRSGKREGERHLPGEIPA